MQPIVLEKLPTRPISRTKKAIQQEENRKFLPIILAHREDGQGAAATCRELAITPYRYYKILKEAGYRIQRSADVSCRDPPGLREEIDRATELLARSEFAISHEPTDSEVDGLSVRGEEEEKSSRKGGRPTNS